MKLLKDRILTEGKTQDGDVLKVGSFLNQRIDADFMMEMGREIATRYQNGSVTKILTIESSGIAIAMAAALSMGVPFVFAKKNKSVNMDDAVYSTRISSFTHGNTYDAVVGKEFLTEEDTVLIIDDFLARGNALNGLIDIVKQSGATLAGAAIAIEKGFQGGGDALRKQGVRVESLALIESMEGGTIEFRR